MNHPELSKFKMKPGEGDEGYTIGNPPGSVNGAPISGTTHGTDCARLLADCYSVNGGSEENLRIVPIAITHVTGTLSIDDFKNGFMKAKNHRAQAASQFHSAGRVICVTLTFAPGNFGTAESIISTEIQNAINDSMVVCVATGNDDRGQLDYPANLAAPPKELNLVAVGACDKDGNRITKTVTRTWGSNYGPGVSVVALGEKYTLSTNNPFLEITFQGTSMATPQVAALAALLLPSLANTDVSTVMEYSADHPSGERNNDIGYGRINISRTIYNLKGVWGTTGSLATPRSYHTATLLLDGNVLVTGGSNDDNSWPTAELYDSETGTWKATGDLMNLRRDHTATLLRDGKVLVAGGNGSGGTLNSAELYDPAMKAWRATGNLATSRGYHSATLLANGKVLVVGGENNDGLVQTAELYDPASGAWSAAGSLQTAPASQNASLLDNGKVMIAGLVGGNESLASAELYNPTRGIWEAIRSPRLPRFAHTATLLPNGKVLVVGGWKVGKIPLASVEIYDPTTGNWSTTTNLSVARRGHSATLLCTGSVLVVGGKNSDVSLASVELYDPTAGVWRATGALTTSRHYHSATLLPNGKVLVAGGKSSDTFLSSAELFTFVR